MFPIRDHNPSHRVPYVTYALMAANILIFLSYAHLLGDEDALFYFFDTWGLNPGYIIDGRHFSTLVTHMFLHGGWMHLLGNMLFLWIFGDNLEDQMGHGPYLLFYLLGGLGAAAGQMAADIYSLVPMVGASGAIAAVMGGYLLLFPKARIDILLFIVIFVRIFPVPAWMMLGIWFAFQIGAGLAGQGGGGVAYWAHAGGFVVGFLLCLPLWIRRGGPAFWTRTEGHPPHPDASYGRLTKSNIPKVRRSR